MHVTFTYLIGSLKGERAEFDASRISIGRASDNMLCLVGARRVSSHHAEVFRRGDGYVLRDLGSTNGTMINGRRVIVSELEHDDLVEFGSGGPLLRFSIAPGEKADQSDGASERGPSVSSSAPRSRGVGIKNNVALIAALVGAMLLGGAAGIIGSSRLRASDPNALSFAEIAEANIPAVVFVRVEFELLDASGQVTTTEARTGSGFIASASGLIITNRHLIRDWEYSSSGVTGRITRIEVILPHQTREDAIPAEVHKVGSTVSPDVAILKINTIGPPFTHSLKPDIDETNLGDEVVVIGYPLGLDLFERTHDATIDPSLSAGVVSRVGHDFIQLSLRAYRGNSGGPVLNRKGEVIGILTANLTAAQDIALCTPISAALTLIGNGLND